MSIMEDTREEKKVSKKELDKIIGEIVKGEYPEEELAVIGENRGQLFVRIPKTIEERMKIKKGQKIRFMVKSVEGGKGKLEIEVV